MGSACKRRCLHEGIQQEQVLEEALQSVQASMWSPEPSKHSNTKINVQDKHGIALSLDMAPRPVSRDILPEASPERGGGGRAGAGEVVQAGGRDMLKEATHLACGKRKCFNSHLNVSKGIF